MYIYNVISTKFMQINYLDLSQDLSTRPHNDVLASHHSYDITEGG